MQQKSLPGVVRFFLGILTFILCVALFASTVATVVVADVRFLASKNTMEDLIASLLTTAAAPASPSVGTLAAGRAMTMVGSSAPPAQLPEEDSSQSEGLLTDYCYELLEEMFGGDVPLTKQQVNQLLEESTLPEFISAKGASLVNDVFTGNLTTAITRNEVVQLLEENKQLFENAFSQPLTAQQIDEVADWAVESGILDKAQEILTETVGITTSIGTSQPQLDTEALTQIAASGQLETEDLPVLLDAFRYLTSARILGICIAACVIFSALMFLAKWGNPSGALYASGCVYLIVGVLSLLVSLFFHLLPMLWQEPAAQVVRKVVLAVTPVHGGVAGLGLVLIIAGAIITACRRKKYGVRE